MHVWPSHQGRLQAAGGVRLWGFWAREAAAPLTENRVRDDALAFIQEVEACILARAVGHVTRRFDSPEDGTQRKTVELSFGAAALTDAVHPDCLAAVEAAVPDCRANGLYVFYVSFDGPLDLRPKPGQERLQCASFAVAVLPWPFRWTTSPCLARAGRCALASSAKVWLRASVWQPWLRSLSATALALPTWSLSLRTFAHARGAAVGSGGGMDSQELPEEASPVPKNKRRKLSEEELGKHALRSATAGCCCRTTGRSAHSARSTGQRTTSHLPSSLRRTWLFACIMFPLHIVLF
jgi:hypothetical protein